MNTRFVCESFIILLSGCTIMFHCFFWEICNGVTKIGNGVTKISLVSAPPATRKNLYRTLLQVLFPVFTGPVLYSCMEFSEIENPVKQEIQEIIQGFLSQAKFPACL